MSAILLEKGLVHYEAFGHGKPVVFLHGWLGSWRYWMPTMEELADRYRAYALDLWGFGDSEKPGEGYRIEEYTEQVAAFLASMGIAQASFVGHSLGGVVALYLALTQAVRVEKLVLVATPVHGAALSGMVKLLRSPLGRLAGARTLMDLWMRSLKRVSAPWAEMYEEIVEDTAKVDHWAVLESLTSLLELDLRSALNRLYAHTLVVFGSRDEFVDPHQANLFADGRVPVAQVVVLDGCRHFPFLEEPGKFNRLLKEFLATPLGQAVAVKDEWRRRYHQTDYL
ncbi:MAG: alpha/beta fold hydrolase [Chloroflexia bacterium]